MSIVEEALSQEPDINETGDKHGTPLHAAALNGSAKIARLLIDRGSRC